MRVDEYITMDGLEMAEMVATGKVAATELIDAAITQIELHNHELNAVIHKTYDRARRTAAAPLPPSPLAGVPFLIKDLSHPVTGSPSTGGSKMLRYNIASADSTLVTRYKAAGMPILGLTNTPEFGASPTTEPELHGPTHNPWRLGVTSGGSSGGAASAVAARFVPVAHASDGGGSIRIPASICGLFGLKPTRARTPKGPYIGEGWFGLSVDHALSVTVRDSAALLDLSHGPDVGAPYYPPPPERSYLSEVGRAPGRLRIAVSTEALLGTELDPECVRAVRETAELLESLGHEVIEATPEVDALGVQRAFLIMLAASTAHGIAEASRIAGRNPDEHLFEELTWILGIAGRKLSSADLAAALELVKSEGRRASALFEDVDVLVQATIAGPPWDIGALQPSAGDRRKLAMAKRMPTRRVYETVIDAMAPDVMERIPNTAMWNVTGQPSMSVPLATSSTGLPIGVMFTGRYAGESTLFRLAGQLEAARPWRDRIPPMVEETLNDPLLRTE